MAPTWNWKVFSVSVLALLIASISFIVNKHVSLPYMDEIFHVPQAQHYCRNNFTHWDPMITTPPGLYFSSFLAIKPINWLLGDDYCITSLLRAQNGIFSLLLFLVFCELFHSGHHSTLVLSSFTLSLFPLLFFFSFLYYTDVGSTLTVLLGYLLSRRGHHCLSSLVLGLSLLFRQTNIIWAGFVGASSILNFIEPQLTASNKKGFLSRFLHLIKNVLLHFPSLLVRVWSYILLAVVFSIFLYVNDGVVLGDKSHHTVSCHLPQLLYFSGFAVFFSIGPLLSRWKYIIKSLVTIKWLLIYVSFSLFGFIAVHYYTIEHPYLLADNRHYPFYIWKNIFCRSFIVKYYLVPVYSACWCIILSVINEHQSVWRTILFLASCLMVLIPQPLLEFRYYIIPYLLYRVSVGHAPLRGTLLELFMYGSVNIVTLWLFIARPFYWGSEENNNRELQRFMW